MHKRKDRASAGRSRWGPYVDLLRSPACVGHVSRRRNGRSAAGRPQTRSRRL